MSDAGHIYLFDFLRLVPPGPGGGTELEVRSARLQSMLGYLILHRKSPVDRVRLGRMLWPESDESAARRYLREYLYRARTLLARFLGGEVAIESDENSLTFISDPDCWIDVMEFRQLIQEARGLAEPGARLPLLQRATTLYTGDLLSNLYDEWLLIERERYRMRFLEALRLQGEALQGMGDLAGAIACNRQILEHDPLQETTHRQLMELYYLQGDRAKALQQYEQCRQILEEELAAQPMAETLSLYRAILGGRQHRPPILPAVPREQPSRLPLVGRDAPLADLTEALQGARQGRLEILLVKGESGSGRTRVVQEWLATVPEELFLLRGQAYEFEQNIPYRPLLDALQHALPLIPWSLLPAGSDRGWLSPLAYLLPDLYFYLPDLPAPSPRDQGQDRHQIVEALAQLLLALARQGPVVLFLDDLHWADLHSWQALLFLARRLRRAPLLLLGTYATSEVAPEQGRHLRALEQAGGRTLTLAPLELSHLATLAARLIDVAPTRQAALAEQIHRLSDGLPLLAVEMLRALAVEGDLPSGERPGETLPDGVRAFILNRLDRLEAESRYLLAVAATIGPDFSPELLARVGGVDEAELLEWLDGWMARGLVEARAGRYAFRHEPLRWVARESLSPPRRERLRREIAHIEAG